MFRSSKIGPAPIPREPERSEFECPRTTGHPIALPKTDLYEILMGIDGFRSSKHYTEMTHRIPLYQTYSKQLLFSLIRHYDPNPELEAYISKPSADKYSVIGGIIRKNRLRHGRSPHHYNDRTQSFTSHYVYHQQRGNHLEHPPQHYQNSLNYILEYELPLAYYNYKHLIIVNIGVGARDCFDSAILFRHFGAFSYYSADNEGYRNTTHSALEIRNPELERVTFHGLANGLSRSHPRLVGATDLSLIIHPKPAYSIEMIRQTVPFLKVGDDGLLLIIVRGEESYNKDTIIAFVQSQPDLQLRKVSQVEFSCENPRTTGYTDPDYAYGRRDYFIMISHYVRNI